MATHFRIAVALNVAPHYRQSRLFEHTALTSNGHASLTTWCFCKAMGTDAFIRLGEDQNAETGDSEC